MAKGIIHNLDGYLAATQLGITLASLGLGWVGEGVMHTIFKNLFDSLEWGLSDASIHTASTIVAFSLITIMHIVFGELAPKSFAIQRPVATTLFVSVPLQIFYVVFRPFIWTLNDIIRKPYFVTETKKINDLMSELQSNRIQIAIVLDEFGGTAGMVTLEDIVEELVGEIQDEYDEEKPLVEKVSDNEFIVNAFATVYDVNEHLPHDLPEDEDFDTIGGLVSHVFERIPEVGESNESYGYLFTILKKTEQNIETIKLELVINKADMVDNH